jgi:hypothetical protein
MFDRIEFFHELEAPRPGPELDAAVLLVHIGGSTLVFLLAWGDTNIPLSCYYVCQATWLLFVREYVERLGKERLSRALGILCKHPRILLEEGVCYVIFMCCYLALAYL